MRSSPAALEALLLSVLPGECAPQLDSLRDQGITVRVASRPDRALALLRRRPNLVLVDLVNGPGLSPRVVTALNRAPRAARVVALHEGRLDAYLEQVQDLAVDGFCRLSGGSGTSRVGEGRASAPGPGTQRGSRGWRRSTPARRVASGPDGVGGIPQATSAVSGARSREVTGKA